MGDTKEGGPVAGCGEFGHKCERRLFAPPDVIIGLEASASLPLQSAPHLCVETRDTGSKLPNHPEEDSFGWYGFSSTPIQKAIGAHRTSCNVAHATEVLASIGGQLLESEERLSDVAFS
jgi:hypothetical protein